MADNQREEKGSKSAITKKQPQKKAVSKGENNTSPANKGRNPQKSQRGTFGKQAGNTSPKANAQPRFAQNKRQRVVIRRDVVSSVAAEIQHRQLTSNEMLALIQALGITPIYTRFRNRDGETEIRFPNHLGPLQYLFNQIASVTQRVAGYKKMVYDGAKLSEEDLSFLSLINASDYDQYGNPVTPEIFMPVLKEVQSVFEEVNTRVQKLQQTRRDSMGKSAPVEEEVRTDVLADAAVADKPKADAAPEQVATKVSSTPKKSAIAPVVPAEKPVASESVEDTRTDVASGATVADKPKGDVAPEQGTSKALDMPKKSAIAPSAPVEKPVAFESVATTD